MIASTPPPPAAGKQWRMEALETVEAVGVLDGSNVWPVKHFGSSAHDCLHSAHLLPLCSQAVQRGENSFQPAKYISGGERGTFLVKKADSTNSSSTPFLRRTFGQFDWFLDIIRRYKTQVSEINPNRRSTFFCERDMVALEEFDHPGPLNEFAWNILGLESKCGDKYLTEPASFKSRRSSRRRNYARIRGDIPSPVQVIVNAMQCGFHTAAGVAESSSDITYAAAAAEITCLKIQSNSSRITVLRSHPPSVLPFN